MQPRLTWCVARLSPITHCPRLARVCSHWVATARELSSQTCPPQGPRARAAALDSLLSGIWGPKGAPRALRPLTQAACSHGSPQEPGVEWVHVGVRGQGSAGPSQGLLSLPPSGCPSPLLTLSPHLSHPLPPLVLPLGFFLATSPPLSFCLHVSLLRAHPPPTHLQLPASLSLSPVPVSGETPGPKRHAGGCVALRPTSWSLPQSTLGAKAKQQEEQRPHRRGGQARTPAVPGAEPAPGSKCLPHLHPRQGLPAPGSGGFPRQRAPEALSDPLGTPVGGMRGGRPSMQGWIPLKVLT